MMLLRRIYNWLFYTRTLRGPDLEALIVRASVLVHHNGWRVKRPVWVSWWGCCAITLEKIR